MASSGESGYSGKPALQPVPGFWSADSKQEHPVINADLGIIILIKHTGGIRYNQKDRALIYELWSTAFIYRIIESPFGWSFLFYFIALIPFQSLTQLLCRCFPFSSKPAASATPSPPSLSCFTLTSFHLSPNCCLRSFHSAPPFLPRDIPFARLCFIAALIILLWHDKTEVRTGTGGFNVIMSEDLRGLKGWHLGIKALRFFPHWQENPLIYETGLTCPAGLTGLW